MFKNRFQTSESLMLGVIMAWVGGFVDAYSYAGRGHVFCNAQTGNLILMGVNFSEGNYSEAVHYLFPILAFIIGIAVADLSRILANRLHWRQICVLIEALVLLYVAFLSQRYNLLANSLASFACGIQVESFRKIYGSNIATTMCIGNLRSATSHLVAYLETGKKGHLKSSALYYFIIFCFVVGAVFGYFAVMRYAEKAALICFVLLLMSFFIMFKEDTAY